MAEVIQSSFPNSRVAASIMTSGLRVFTNQYVPSAYDSTVISIATVYQRHRYYLAAVFVKRVIYEFTDSTQTTIKNITVDSTDAA